LTELAPKVRGRLRTIDEALAARVGTPASLAPGRSVATCIEALGVRLLTGREPVWAEAFVDGMAAIVTAELENFPENLFWDADYLAAALLEEADTPDDLTGLVEAVVRLHRLFGRHSPIRFRYLHDFSYGFDWARWAAREPATRAAIGPFSAPFLTDLEHRGAELCARIEANDARYPQLPQGEARNPFAFSREPEHEWRLLTDLAARDLVPVPAWQLDARPCWRRPYADLRLARARALGLATD